MGFRFRRSLRLAPGIRINLSKMGSSLSTGRRGATMNTSSRGTKATVGLPGSGISRSTMLSSGPETALPKPEPGGIGVVWTILIAMIVVAVLLSLH
jgi:hypothetical protein